MMIHEAIFRIETEYAEIISQALEPEEDTEYPGRSHGTCTQCADDILEVQVRASDLSSLRAALNTWLRLIQVTEEISDRAQICTSITHEGT
jgi:KEOPS complex subunit Pcc1